MSKSPKKPHGVKSGTADANRCAIAILEVLAGVRTPAQAAEALAISVPRYYQLETRALDALVAACEPKPRGKRPSPEGRIAALERELAAARRDCARQQALARLAQRSVGLKSPAPPAKSAKREGRRGKRRPAARALRAVDALRKNVRPPDAKTVQQPVTDAAPTGTSAKDAN